MKTKYFVSTPACRVIIYAQINDTGKPGFAWTLINTFTTILVWRRMIYNQILRFRSTIVISEIFSMAPQVSLLAQTKPRNLINQGVSTRIYRDYRSRRVWSWKPRSFFFLWSPDKVKSYWTDRHRQLKRLVIPDQDVLLSSLKDFKSLYSQ